MKLVPKLDENGNLVMVEEGGIRKVVYVDEDDNNKEYPLDPAAMYVKITNLGAENKTHREKAKAAETTLKVFESIEGIDMEKPQEWIENASNAIATVKNYEDKDLIEAGKVDEVKQEMRDAYEGKLTAKDEVITSMKATHETDIAGKDGQIRTLMVSNRFNTSKYFTGEKSVTTMPPDVAEAFFGKHFQVETVDGKPVLKAYREDGRTEFMSKLNPGEPADFEEAIGLIIDKYPNKESILRAPEGGSGGQGGQGGGHQPDELSKLEADLKKAEKDGDAAKMVTIKNAIWKIKQQKQ